MKIEEKNGELVITDFNQLEAYKIACKIEKDGILFYKSLLDRVEAKEAKEEIKFLLEEERKHLGFFERRLSEMRQKMDDGFEEDDLFNYLDYGIFEPFLKAKDMVAQKIKDAQQALRLGIIIEQKAIDFYYACGKKISSEVKDEIINIAKEEKRHKAVFEKMAGVSAKR